MRRDHAISTEAAMKYFILGALASGMELCAMYPITPATSVSHFLAEEFETFVADSLHRQLL